MGGGGGVEKGICVDTVGKRTPWYLSFVVYVARMVDYSDCTKLQKTF